MQRPVVALVVGMFMAGCSGSGSEEPNDPMYFPPDASGTVNGPGGGDGGMVARGDGGTLLIGDAGLPDVVAPEDSYAISDGTGRVVQQNPGTLPAGDPNSDTYVQPFDGNTTFIPGGTNRFTGAWMGRDIDALVVGFKELAGFHVVPVNSSPFVFHVTLGQAVTRSTLTLVVIPAIAVDEDNPNGGFGRPLHVPCTVQRVGTGALQVSLSWHTDSDVDLHLVEPNGREIYYHNKESSSGGTLDLDSNPDCRLDHVENENITYEGVTPPRGHYKVRVDYYAACNVAGNTDYTVTVTIRGQPTVYQGSFRRSDQDEGGAGSGVTVAEFDF